MNFRGGFEKFRRNTKKNGFVYFAFVVLCGGPGAKPPEKFSDIFSGSPPTIFQKFREGGGIQRDIDEIYHFGHEKRASQKLYLEGHRTRCK